LKQNQWNILDAINNGYDTLEGIHAYLGEQCNLSIDEIERYLYFGLYAGGYISYENDSEFRDAKYILTDEGADALKIPPEEETAGVDLTGYTDDSINLRFILLSFSGCEENDESDEENGTWDESPEEIEERTCPLKAHQIKEWMEEENGLDVKLQAVKKNIIVLYNNGYITVKDKERYEELLAGNNMKRLPWKDMDFMITDAGKAALELSLKETEVLPDDEENSSIPLSSLKQFDPESNTGFVFAQDEETCWQKFDEFINDEGFIVNEDSIIAEYVDNFSLDDTVHLGEGFLIQFRLQTTE